MSVEGVAIASRSRSRKPRAWRMRDPKRSGAEIVKRTSTSFYLVYHASVFDQCEQVHGKHLWNTAVKVCGTTRDTLGKAWIRSVTSSTLRLVAFFPRLLYRYANERNVALGKHCLAVWSWCRVIVGGSIDPIGSLFLSIEVHETCVCGITFALVLRPRKMSAAGLVRDLGGPYVVPCRECQRWCRTRRCQSVLLCCSSFECRQTSC